MPVFSATYTGKGYNQRVKARSAEWERKKKAEYDRNHLRMLDLRAEQKAQERVMRKTKLASNARRRLTNCGLKTRQHRLMISVRNAKVSGASKRVLQRR
jgi:hypothetical protein